MFESLTLGRPTADASGWIATAVGAMMADTADEHEWLYGSRREAL